MDHTLMIASLKDADGYGPSAASPPPGTMLRILATQAFASSSPDTVALLAELRVIVGHTGTGGPSTGLVGDVRRVSAGTPRASRRIERLSRAPQRATNSGIPRRPDAGEAQEGY